MKRFITLTMLSFLFFSLVVPVAYAETPKENVIIVYKDGVTQKDKAVKGVNGEVKDVFKNIPVATGKVPKASIALLKKNKDILAVEVDQQIQIKGQIQDWGTQAVNAPASWDSQITGKGIKIAVLDTGISAHEDLLVAGGVSFVAYTTSYADDNGHGQHVAGIIGAENNGIGTIGSAPDADIFAVKVLDQNGSGYLSDIIKGIDWSITNKMDIINLSLGAQSHSLSLQQAVDKAYNSGILVVAAAGNDGNADGSGDTVDYPARYDAAIAVLAIDSSKNRGSFSATGPTVEVSAPGVRVLSTYLNNQYTYMSGTSMATPYVAGTLALLKQANPTLTHSLLREKLKQTAVDIGVTGKDAFFGYGLVQAPVQMQVRKEEPAPAQEQPSSEPTDSAPTQEQLSSEPTPTQEPAPAPVPVVQPAPAPVKQPVKTVPKKIITKPAKKSLTATLSTAKSTYIAGNTIWVNVKAVDKVTKKPIVNGTVKLTITPPKGKAKVVTLKTNKKGVASYKMTTNKRSTGKGTYKLSTLTSVTNYHVTSASKKIRIK